MSDIVLDTVVEHGQVRAAAVVRRTVSVGAERGRVYGGANKEPVAILVAVGSALHAFDSEGVEIAPEDVERLCPGAISAFSSR